MKTQARYGMGRTVRLPYEKAVERVREELQKQGFGVLTEIDVRATLQKKLEVDFRPYIILGACNPGFAHQALSREIDIGLLLPCNVIVYAGADEGTSEVAALDPEVALSLSGNEAVAGIARDVKARLEMALAEVAK